MKRFYYCTLALMANFFVFEQLQDAELFSGLWWVRRVLGVYTLLPIYFALGDLFRWLWGLLPKRTTPDPYHLIDNKPSVE